MDDARKMARGRLRDALQAQNRAAIKKKWAPEDTDALVAEAKSTIEKGLGAPEPRHQMPPQEREDMMDRKEPDDDEDDGVRFVLGR